MSEARSAPSALRNREPIARVLRDWLPPSGLVLEVASGTGQHAAYFAEVFPHLNWQPTDTDPAALGSIKAWRQDCGLPNLREAILLDAGGSWPELRPDAILCINMAHISPWSATVGLVSAAASLLAAEAPLIFYGPWLASDISTAPSNLEFDAQLRSRDPAWCIRSVEDLEALAAANGIALAERRLMPANNLMLRLQKMKAR